MVTPTQEMLRELWAEVKGELGEVSDEACATVVAALIPYRMEQSGEQRAGRKSKARRAKPAVEGPRADALRAFRAKESKRRRLPAYIVLHDRSIAAMIQQRPTTETQLADIPGIGAAKVRQYGSELLRIVNDPTIPDAPAPANGGQGETEDEEYERVKAKQAIRAAMMGKRMTEARIATVTELPAALVARALASLVEQKQITQRDGKWSLVKKDS
jgi:ribonuclease D